jgi:phage terminase large subunit
MVADCAEPDRIEEIYQHDYDVHACHKGVDSVRRGIDIVRSKKIYYHLESDNLRKESSAYKWREDAKGNGLDEPVKFNDHLMDAVRYGIAYGEDDIQIVYGGEGVEEVATMAVLAGMDDEEDEWKDWE